MTGAARPAVGLAEARQRLKDLGYLDGRVERFVFRRALAGRGGLFLPGLLSLAFAAALNLPVIVICENNGWSELTQSTVTFKVARVAQRAASCLPAKT